LFVGFNLQTLALCNLSGGSNQQHIAFKSLIQPLGLEDNIQRLIPGNIFEPHGNTASYRITGNQVQFGKISNQLEYGTNFNILEIKGQLFTNKGKFGLPFFEFNRRQGLEADHIAVICLIGNIIISTIDSLDRYCCGCAFSAGINGFDRSRKIDHIQTLVKRCRQVGMKKLRDDFCPCLGNIDANGGVGKGQCDHPFTLLTAGEVDILNRTITGAHCRGILLIVVRGH